MKSFPTVFHLANATDEEVNAHWAGLGFYRRARLLHKGAKKVVNEMDGTLPETVEDLLKIDGIGRYTASAVASIAFGQCVPVVDGNVCRVLSRLCAVANHIKSPVLKDGLGWKLAQQIVGTGHSYAGEINQAMMELGATYCSPTGTGLDENDPLKPFYKSTKLAAAFLRHERKRRNQTQHDASFAAGMNATNSLYEARNRTKKDGESLDDDHPLLTSIVDDYYLLKAKDPDAHPDDTDDDSSKSRCKLCAQEGIRDVLLSLAKNSIIDGTDSCVGHGPFPLPPPKGTKREEVLSVGVFSVTTQGQRRWLMIKRPKHGMLAGQWEFPNVCVWSSRDRDTGNANKNKDKGKGKNKAIKGGKGNKKAGTTSSGTTVPVVDAGIRSTLLTDFLLGTIDVDLDPRMEFDNDVRPALSLLFQDSGTCRNVIPSPIEHVFSHVRHTMWIEWLHRPDQDQDEDGDDEDELRLLTKRDGTLCGFEIRWMTTADMKTVGVTSGVKKVLAAVEKHRAASGHFGS